MFKKSKEKIVALIMLFLVLILAGTVGIIYATTFREVYTNDQNLLKEFTEGYIDGWHADEKPMDDRHKPVHSVIFYAVIFNADHSVFELVNDLKPVLDDEQLTKVAGRLAAEGKNDGISDNLVYRITKAEDRIYVVMMDNRIMGDSMTALVKNTTLFGCVALVLLFILSLKLADRIVKPLEEGYTKQKQFISDAGHELKTPISTILANSEMLEREIGKNQWLNNIVFENQRMQELVGQLLELARTEHVSPVLEQVNVSRTVMGGILPFEGMAYEKGYRIVSDITDEIYMLGEQKQLGQLVATLMDNALSHAEGEGVISVSLKMAHHMILLSVSNSGKEIPDREREKIFERFYRTDEARNLNGHYGLGLAIAKAITVSHNGRISVDCVRGITTFTAVIPQKK